MTVSQWSRALNRLRARTQRQALDQRYILADTPKYGNNYFTKMKVNEKKER